jgi:hypothetical protein
MAANGYITKSVESRSAGMVVIVFGNLSLMDRLHNQRKALLFLKELGL